MIVVCGALTQGQALDGSSIAVRAAAFGGAVQVVGIVAGDPAGDRRLIELGAAGVGHAAVLREPTRDMEPADLDLALRYLPEIRVVVIVDATEAVVTTAADHATWSGAALVVVRGHASAGASELTLPASAIVLEAPSDDPDGTFAGFVGALAAKLDAGATPADAWAATTRELAVDPA